MKKIINLKSLLFLTITFILFTPIGTILHEFGHIVVAKSLGYETTLHYGSMNYRNSNLNKKQIKIYNENKITIESNTYFNQKKEYEKGIDQLYINTLLVTIGGPLQTIITGFIGLLILFFRKKKINKSKLKLIDWLAIFLSLFWLRQVFNLLISVISELISPNGSYFGGDEKRISNLLNLWPGTTSVTLGIIGIVIFAFILIKRIPKQLKITFLLSGLLGGTLGFIIWMIILGPILLP